jgi:ActR/RegA family two-component response regulator
MSEFPVLIVEDNVAFQEIYRRAVERQNRLSFVASSFTEARDALQRQLFSVAVIDIRLSESDDTDEGGIRVLQCIRELGDLTRSIVITGYGTVHLGWEAAMLDAFEIFSKSDMSLPSLNDAISRAHQEFEMLYSRAKTNFSEILKGPNIPLWEWEHLILKTCPFSGGIQKLYSLFDLLLGEFAPLNPYATAPGCLIDDTDKFAAGLFWSRARGLAIFIAFGKKAVVERFEGGMASEHIKKLFPHEGHLVLESHPKIIKAGEFYGVLRIMEKQGFSSFRGRAQGR